MLLGSIHRAAFSIMGVLAALGFVPLADAQTGPRTYSMNFEEIDASNGPVDVFNIGPYLASQNILTVSWLIGCAVGVYDTRREFGGMVHPPNEDHNVLMLSVQTPDPDDPNPQPTAPPFGLIFAFAQPVTRLEFVRPAFAGSAASPFTHPAWYANGIGNVASNEVLATIAEPAITTTSATGKHVCTLVAPDGLSFNRVTFVSDPTQGPNGQSSVPSLLIDSMSMTTVPGPSTAALILAGTGFTAASRLRRRPRVRS